MKVLITALLLLPFIASAQVAVRTQCPKHNWVGRAGENCPRCVAEAANRNARVPAIPGVAPVPAPGLSPGMQATSEVIQKGFSSLLDALLTPSPAPTVDPQRARELQQQADQARQAEQQRHERLLGSLMLSGNTSSAALAPQDNPLGLKLGRSAQDTSGASADGLRPAGTAFFGLGGDGTPSSGSATNGPSAPGSTRPSNDTKSASQLVTAAGGQANAVFDGKGARSGGGLKPLDFKRLPVSIKENTEFLKLNLKRNESISLYVELQAQIAALRMKLATSGNEAGLMEAHIRELEARQRQAEVYVDYSNQEMKRQFKFDVEEQ